MEPAAYDQRDAARYSHAGDRAAIRQDKLAPHAIGGAERNHARARHRRVRVARGTRENCPVADERREASGADLLAE